MTMITPAFEKNFENEKILNGVENLFSNIRGYGFKMPQFGEAVILTLSGGLDSVVLWSLLLNKYHLNVYPVHFSGQNPGAGKAIAFFSSYFKKRFPNLFHPVAFEKPTRLFHVGQKLSKKLINNNLPFLINNLIYNKNRKHYGVGLIAQPARFFYFNIWAFEYANRLRFRQGIRINTIFSAVVPDDAFFIRESTLTVIRAVNLAFSLIFNDLDWQFAAPVDKKNRFYYSKTSLLRYAHKIDLPVEKTWSCDKKTLTHCGECPSCRTRIEIFKRTRITDKTLYQNGFGRRLKNKFKQSPFSRWLDRIKEKITLKPSGKKVKITDSLIIYPTQSVDWYEKGSEFFLFNKKYGDLERLNDSGSQVWKIIAEKGPLSFEKIIFRLEKKYKVKKNQLVVDVRKFITSLVQKEYADIKPSK